MRRSVLGAILVAALLGAGCGDDSDKGSGSQGDGTSGDGDGASGDGDGASGDGDGASGDGDGDGDGDGPSLNECEVNDTSCTDAELEEYSSCITTQCGATYQDCYGEGYAQGNYGGPCGDWLSCTQACACNDISCYAACGQPSDACSTCLLSATTCIQDKCTEPACYSIPPEDSNDPGDNASCEDLAACCASIVDANTKGSCEAGYEQASMTGDTACGILYSSFVQAQFCE